MFLKIAFGALLLLTTGFTALFGGRAGRWGAAIFITAALLSVPAANGGWSSANLHVLLVDAACLVGLLVLARFSGRWWPVWAAGMQIASTASHVAIMFVPGAPPMVYAALEAFWSIPILLVMLIGTLKDRGDSAPNP